MWQNRQRKKTSSNIFKYVIYADDEQAEDLGIDLSSTVRELWRLRIERHPHVKLDDVGDALLHALNDILCGSSNYRQLVPTHVSSNVNRTVAIAVKPDFTYYAVLHCTWNCFELEDMGFFSSNIFTKYFNSFQAVSDIKARLLSQIKTGLTDFSGGDEFKMVDTIKVVVKQLKGYSNLQQERAGTLTKSAVLAVKQVS